MIPAAAPWPPLPAPLWHSAIVFGLILVRVGALVVACPPFVPESLLGRFRAALCLWLSVAMVGAVPAVVLPQSFLWAGILEFMLGAGMGLSVRLGAVALSFAGEMLETVAGFSFMQLVNPMTREQAGPMRTLFQVIGGMVFFVAGGQTMVIEALAESFVRLPPGAAPWQPRMGVALVHQLAAVMHFAIRLAAPLLASALTTLCALAFLTKVAPQLNIWSVGFVITCSIMLVGMIWYTPSWMEQVASMWQQRCHGMLPTLVGTAAP